MQTSNPHRYQFKLYALNNTLKAQDSLDTRGLLAAMDGIIDLFFFKKKKSFKILHFETIALIQDFILQVLF